MVETKLFMARTVNDRLEERESEGRGGDGTHLKTFVCDAGSSEVKL